ncbi:MAG: radical SAM protein [Candidatus Woesearchaeota archaeon]
MREEEAKSILVQETSDLYSCTHASKHYSGCSLGCAFCNSTEPVAYTNAPALLLKEISDEGAIALCSGNEDPYQPGEENLRLTRRVLEVLYHHPNPVHIITRSTLVTRDMDLLQNACVSFSFASLDKKMSAILEPSAPLPQDRLDAMKSLVKQGICCGMVFMPILPYITDTPEHIETMFNTAKEYGASFVIDSPLQLTDKEPFFQYMEQQPRLRRFLNRYQRLYKNHSVPYGKIMQNINKICFDMSKKYDIARRWNLKR